MARQLSDGLDRARCEAGLSHALNERFVELGGNQPVAYSDDEITALQEEATP